MKKLFALLMVCALLLTVTACGKPDPTEGFTEIMWPTSALVSRLPVPESTFGDINSESADYFSVDIGNVTQAQFNAYVAACQEAGFTVEYSKSSSSFSAYDEEGYYVWVYYEPDDGIMDIMTRIPETDEDVDVDQTTTTTTKKATTTTTTAAKSDSIGSDFKAAMDAYETFMNKYVDFMKKYQNNPSDLSLLADYATYMSDYAKFCSDFAEWEDEDLNAAELAYYVDVQARVTKKLLEVAG